jgi:hypothetical protein
MSNFMKGFLAPLVIIGIAGILTVLKVPNDISLAIMFLSGMALYELCFG